MNLYENEMSFINLSMILKKDFEWMKFLLWSSYS